MASRYHATSTLHCARFLACYCAGHLRLLRAEKIVEPSRNLVRREVSLDLAVGGPHQGPLPGVVAPYYLPAVVCSSVMSRWKGACACGCREVLLYMRAWVRGCVRAACVCVCILTTSAPKPSPTAFALQGTIPFTHWSPSLHSTLALCLVSLSPKPPSTFTTQYSSTVFSPTPIGPLAHYFWFWFDAVLHLFLSWAALYQSSPTFTAVRSVFADSSISFADLCSVVSWATTLKDTALGAYSPASRKHVQANPDDVSSVSFLLSRCLALLSYSC